MTTRERKLIALCGDMIYEFHRIWFSSPADSETAAELKQAHVDYRLRLERLDGLKRKGKK